MAFTPIESSANWTGPELMARDDWKYTLTAEEIAEIDGAFRAFQASGHSLVGMRREDFPLYRFPKVVEKALSYLEDGPGIYMVRGFPVERYNTNELRIIYWGLGKYLGTAVSQSSEGDVIGDVRDMGIPKDSPRHRGYKTNRGERFHCDSCDVAALFVLRAAMKGGVSLAASSIAIHNEIGRSRPDLLEVLYQPFIWSMQQQERPGEAPYYPQPIFTMHDGHFACRYVQGHIHSAQRFPEVPRLTDAQKEAIDLINELVAKPEFSCATNFQPGDLQLVNNHVLLHGRTTFHDYPEVEKRRHLLRMWLSVPNSRPLSPHLGHIYRDRSPGAVRGGFPARNPGAIVFETTEV
jgi:hypothetical protein